MVRQRRLRACGRLGIAVATWGLLAAQAHGSAPPYPSYEMTTRGAGWVSRHRWLRYGVRAWVDRIWV